MRYAVVFVVLLIVVINLYFIPWRDDITIVITTVKSEKWSHSGCATYRSHDICLIMERNRSFKKQNEALVIIVDLITVNSGIDLYKNAIDLKIENVFIVASDLVSHTILLTNSVPHVYRNPEYRRIDKISIAEEVVLLDCSVLLVDPQSILKTNPFLLLKREFDFEVIQNEYINDTRDYQPSISLSTIFIRATYSSKAALRSTIHHRRIATDGSDSEFLFSELFGPKTDGWSHAGASVGFLNRRMLLSVPFSVQISLATISRIDLEVSIVTVGGNDMNLLPVLKRSSTLDTIRILQQQQQRSINNTLRINLRSQISKDYCPVNLVINSTTKPRLAVDFSPNNFRVGGMMLVVFSSLIDPSAVARETNLYKILQENDVLSKTIFLLQHTSNTTHQFNDFTSHAKKEGIGRIYFCSPDESCKWKIIKNLLQEEVRLAVFRAGSLFIKNPLSAFVGDSDFEGSAVTCLEESDWTLYNRTVGGLSQPIIAAKFSGIDSGYLLLRNTRGTRHVIRKIINNLSKGISELYLMRTLTLSRDDLPQTTVRIISRSRVPSLELVLSAELYLTVPIAVSILDSSSLLQNVDKMKTFFSEEEINERKNRNLKLNNASESPFVWNGKWVKKENIIADRLSHLS